MALLAIIRLILSSRDLFHKILVVFLTFLPSRHI